MTLVRQPTSIPHSGSLKKLGSTFSSACQAGWSGGSGTKFQVRLGKHPVHQFAKALIEIAAAAALLGKQESAPVDVHPQPLDFGVGELRCFAAIDEQDRRFQQVFDRGHCGSMT